MKKYNQANSRWLLLGLLLPILMFFASLSATYAYFTATASQQNSSMRTAQVKLTFEYGTNNSTYGSTIISTQNETKFFKTRTITHEQKVVPGDTVEVYSQLNNTGNVDIYTMVEFSVYVQKQGGNDTLVHHKFYVVNGSTLTEITYNSSTNTYTASVVLAANASKAFTVSFTYDFATYDNSYKGASSHFELVGHAIQTANLPTETGETVAQAATKLMMERIADN